ncbi:MAG: response regulator [Candidatus Hydrogenedentes bacterium]|nr:response regulator [Candidatus Hydrogenedentota bacterium]
MRILLVEDNPGDVYLFKAALAECSAEADVTVFDNGLHAWTYLEKIAAGNTAPPDLIVLDLNLPGMGGRQILSEMATRPELHKIPICIFTGAGSEGSIVDEHPPLRLCFFAKVDSFNKLCEIVSSFLNFAGASSSV